MWLVLTAFRRPIAIPAAPVNKMNEDIFPAFAPPTSDVAQAGRNQSHMWLALTALRRPVAILTEPAPPNERRHLSGFRAAPFLLRMDGEIPIHRWLVSSTLRRTVAIPAAPVNNMNEDIFPAFAPPTSDIEQAGRN